METGLESLHKTGMELCWSLVGQYIFDHMLKMKGIIVPKLGIFTFTYPLL